MSEPHAPRLLVQPAPFLRPTVSTPRIMGDVLIALAPTVVAAVWFFGLSVLLLIAVVANPGERVGPVQPARPPVRGPGLPATRL